MDKKNKKKNNTKKSNKKIFSVETIIVLIVSLISLVICGIILYNYLHSNTNDTPSQEVVVTNTIDGYDYTLKDTDTSYYKENFEKLKKTLESETKDDELYARLISQLFATDFYTLSNKIGSSDIGGSIFISSNYRDNFMMKAKDTIYKSVKSNLYGDRSQELPTVSKVAIDSITTTTYNYGDINDSNAYSVKASISYESNLGYPTEVRLTLVHRDNVIEIVKVN